MRMFVYIFIIWSMAGDILEEWCIWFIGSLWESLFIIDPIGSSFLVIIGMPAWFWWWWWFSISEKRGTKNKYIFFLVKFLLLSLVTRWISNLASRTFLSMVYDCSIIITTISEINSSKLSKFFDTNSYWILIFSENIIAKTIIWLPSWDQIHPIFSLFDQSWFFRKNCIEVLFNFL